MLIELVLRAEHALDGTSADVERVAFDAQQGWHETCCGGASHFECRAPLWEVWRTSRGVAETGVAEHHVTE